MNVRLLALLGAVALLFFVGLGRPTLFDQDEAKYTQVAREILETGDPITLHVNGAPWFVHPPLYMWLVAATGRIFGFTEFTARLWSAVAGVAGVYATYLLGGLLFPRRAALLGAAVLAGTFQYFAHARLAVFDGLLVTFMLLTFYAFLRALYDVSRAHAYYAAVWAGLGTLTKGPIALLLPALVALVYLIIRWKRFRWRAPILGPAAVYAAIAMPWYIIEAVRHGAPFISTVIGYYTVNRFLGVVEGQSGPWWYYAPVFGVGAFPWTAFVLAMLPHHARRLREEGSLLVLLWTAITIVFYSMAGTKLPNYVLPVYPWAALGIAAMWHAAFDGERGAAIRIRAAFVGTAVALLIFAGEIAAFARLKYPAALAALQGHLIIAATVLGAWVLAAAGLYLLRRPVSSFVMLAATMWVFGGILVFGTLPMIDARRPIKEVAAAVRARLTPETPLVGYRISSYQTLLFYTNHRVDWVDDARMLRQMRCSHPRMIIVTEPEEMGELQQFPATRLITTEDLVAVEVRNTSCP